MGRKRDTADFEIAAIAVRQHGVITHRQLRGVGLGTSAISKRAGGGRLHRLHRGVYAVGHRGLAVEGRWMAAVFASGAGAVISHADAAALWGLLRPVGGLIHVSVPTGAGRSASVGIRLHRRPALRPADSTRRNRIPVTSVARTIADLDGSVPDRLARRARRQAELVGLLADASSDRTRSDLERSFLRLCRDRRVPAPEVNVRVAGLTVDFLWREDGLVVETDSFRYHRGRVAFEDDRARDLALREAGLDVIRVADRQLDDEPGRVIDLVTNALRRGLPSA
ncbi:MAG TPA: type IV toxin-antitoxin system AbiEi family antitoxin domain-containing protein [Solirubrobacterales bacterium]